MRAFIAIELPIEIKEALKKLQEELKKSGADVKWVAPENIHLTLKFLGEIDQKKSAEVIGIIREAAEDNGPFLIGFDSVGVFPKINFPRVIWVGIAQGDEETKKIAAELEEKLAAIGIAKEKRPFSSHITIGRVRSLKNKDGLITKLDNLAGYFKDTKYQFKAAQITLFKSTLTPKGPLYEIQKQASLKAA